MYNFYTEGNTEKFNQFNKRQEWIKAGAKEIMANIKSKTIRRENIRINGRIQQVYRHKVSIQQSNCSYASPTTN